MTRSCHDGCIHWKDDVPMKHNVGSTPWCENYILDKHPDILVKELDCDSFDDGKK